MKSYTITVTDTVVASSPEEAARMLAARIGEGEETTYQVVETEIFNMTDDIKNYSDFVTISYGNFSEDDYADFYEPFPHEEL